MGTKRRKLGNPLALAVMVLLMEKPMHPYEIAQTLRRRGKDTTTKINYGSLYTVVQNLEKHGFVEVAEVQRQGNRPSARCTASRTPGAKRRRSGCPICWRSRPGSTRSSRPRSPCWVCSTPTR
ncbi:hypothetical protein SAVCW2_10940 [Streptomyces avermitilis]|nr:hypothetical protein SAVCW2_10940 [Streptomyces avermitilis]